MAALRETFRDAEITLTPSGGGVFEVTLDGVKVFSKKELDRHPRPGEIIDLIRGRGN